jgi:hypothetical protein
MKRILAISILIFLSSLIIYGCKIPQIKVAEIEQVEIVETEEVAIEPEEAIDPVQEKLNQIEEQYSLEL